MTPCSCLTVPPCLSLKHLLRSTFLCAALSWLLPALFPLQLKSLQVPALFPPKPPFQQERSCRLSSSIPTVPRFMLLFSAPSWSCWPVLVKTPRNSLTFKYFPPCGPELNILSPYFLSSPSLGRKLQKQVNITFWTALNLKYSSWNLSGRRLLHVRFMYSTCIASFRHHLGLLSVSVETLSRRLCFLKDSILEKKGIGENQESDISQILWESLTSPKLHS